MEKLNTLKQQFKLTITDSRTGKTYEIPGYKNYFNASDMMKIQDDSKAPLRSYDPGYLNTINCTSKISFIDGDKGILEYRGYPIEQLAEKSSYLEVAFLLIFGELPSQNQLKKWTNTIMHHTFVHKDVNEMMKSFRYDAHPMGMLISTLAAISTFHPEANPSLSGQNIYSDQKFRNKQIYRLIGTIPTIAANSYRHRIGRNFNKPSQGYGYVENYLFMIDHLNDIKYQSHPEIVKALDILFILHAEHELNCSTAAVRHLASSGVDIYTIIAGSASALYGHRHGGANEAVLRMLGSIKHKKNIPQFIEDVKHKKTLLYGFGHRVYKSYDPRATIVKKVADKIFDVLGKEPLVEIALELEKIALSDEFFIKRQLYPNVDFYTGVIYKALGFPTDMFPVLFTIPRLSGWLAHWNEFMSDPENKIVRPRQNYLGHTRRDYIALEDRRENDFKIETVKSSNSIRRIAGKNVQKQ